jgi:putative membrane protein
MIKYNTKDWWAFIFKLHKADTISKLAFVMLTIGIYTGVVVYLVQDVFHLSENNLLKNIPIMHTLLGAVISLLLVFRTNTAYDRWWEGRKQWGALTNNSRSLAIKLHTLIPETIKEKSYLFSNITLYPFALKLHLQKKGMDTELFDEDEVTALLDQVNTEGHVPNQIAFNIANTVKQLQKQGTISEFDLLHLHDEIKGYSDICGACERIHNTPIPFSYVMFIKKFVFLYIMTLPFGFTFTLGYVAIPVVVFIFYVLASLELIAEEIEDPFGSDSNDLPMEKMAKNIKKHVEEIMNIR